MFVYTVTELFVLQRRCMFIYTTAMFAHITVYYKAMFVYSAAMFVHITIYDIVTKKTGGGVVE